MLSDYVAYASGALAPALLLVERQHLQVFNLTIDHSGGGSRPSDKGGPGYPDPEVRWGLGGGGAVSKPFFFGSSGLIFV